MQTSPAHTVTAADSGLIVKEHISLSSRLAFGRAFLRAMARQQAMQRAAQIVRNYLEG